MNILPYVMTMLMLLALMTYARQNFRTFSGLQAQFKNYMEKTEREYNNTRTQDVYENIHFARTTGGGSKVLDLNKKACSYISINLFIKSNERDKKNAVFEQTRDLLKKLIEQLYDTKTFFIKAKKTHPNLVEALLSELENVADTAEKTNQPKITKTSDLANVKIKDAVISDCFTKMLKGQLQDNSQNQDQHQQQHQNENLNDLNGDEPAAENEDDLPAGISYDSLLNFITIKSTTEIRVYLASREILMAIYEDARFIEEILEKRKELYKRIREIVDTKELEVAKTEATQEFKDLCGNQSGGAFNLILNFDVTKTDPQPYEKARH